MAEPQHAELNLSATCAFAPIHIVAPSHLNYQTPVPFLVSVGKVSGTFPFPSTLPGGAVGPPTAFFTASSSASSDWLFTARNRIGWANDNLLIYGTGGLAVANVKVNQTPHAGLRRHHPTTPPPVSLPISHGSA